MYFATASSTRPLMSRFASVSMRAWYSLFGSLALCFLTNPANFTASPAQRLADLQKQIAPLKADRHQHHATIHRLRFEEVIANDGNAEQARLAREKAEAELAELQAKIRPLQQEINQLGRQFWVNKDQVKANNYDLSASRYRQVEQDEVFYEKPEVTLERMRELDQVASGIVRELEKAL